MIAKTALETGRGVTELVLEQKLLTRQPDRPRFSIPSG